MLSKLIKLPDLDNDIWLWCQITWASFFDTLDIAHKSKAYRELFDSIQTYCIFIGYPRSGHSLIGSLIDAHPNAVISHRLDSLKYVTKGYSPTEIFYLIWCNSQRFATTGRMLTGYKYHVPHQRQGSFEKLYVVGDQEGKWTSIRLGQNPHLFESLLQYHSYSLKLLHVTRNPYDNITTWAKRMGRSLTYTSKAYFSLCHSIKSIMNEENGFDLLQVRYEKFLEEPKEQLIKLCQFLNLEASEDYLRDCVKLVYPRPHQSRYQQEWTPELIQSVQEQMKEFSFLEGYSFDY